MELPLAVVSVRSLSGGPRCCLVTGHSVATVIGFSQQCAGDLCCTLTVESASTGTTKAHAHELTLASHSARGCPSSVLEHPQFTRLCCNLSEHENGSSTASNLSLKWLMWCACRRPFPAHLHPRRPRPLPSKLLGHRQHPLSTRHPQYASLGRVSALPTRRDRRLSHLQTETRRSNPFRATFPFDLVLISRTFQGKTLRQMAPSGHCPFFETFVC